MANPIIDQYRAQWKIDPKEYSDEALAQHLYTQNGGGMDRGAFDSQILGFAAPKQDGFVSGMGKGFRGTVGSMGYGLTDAAVQAGFDPAEDYRNYFGGVIERNQVAEDAPFSAHLGNVVGQGGASILPAVIPGGAALRIGAMGASAYGSIYGSGAHQQDTDPTATVDRGRLALTSVPSMFIEMSAGPQRAIVKGLTRQLTKEGIDAAYRQGGQGAVDQLVSQGVKHGLLRDNTLKYFGKQYAKQGAGEVAEEYAQMPFEQYGTHGDAGITQEALARGAMGVTKQAPAVFLGAGALGGGVSTYMTKNRSGADAYNSQLVVSEQLAADPSVPYEQRAEAYRFVQNAKDQGWRDSLSEGIIQDRDVALEETRQKMLLQQEVDLLADRQRTRDMSAGTEMPLEGIPRAGRGRQEPNTQFDLLGGGTSTYNPRKEAEARAVAEALAGQGQQIEVALMHAKNAYVTAQRSGDQDGMVRAWNQAAQLTAQLQDMQQSFGIAENGARMTQGGFEFNPEAPTVNPSAQYQQLLDEQDQQGMEPGLSLAPYAPRAAPQAPVRNDRENAMEFEGGLRPPMGPSPQSQLQMPSVDASQRDMFATAPIRSENSPQVLAANPSRAPMYEVARALTSGQGKLAVQIGEAALKGNNEATSEFADAIVDGRYDAALQVLRGIEAPVQDKTVEKVSRAITLRDKAMQLAGGTGNVQALNEIEAEAKSVFDKAQQDINVLKAKKKKSSGVAQEAQRQIDNLEIRFLIAAQKRDLPGVQKALSDLADLEQSGYGAEARAKTTRMPVNDRGDIAEVTQGEMFGEEKAEPEVATFTKKTLLTLKAFDAWRSGFMPDEKYDAVLKALKNGQYENIEKIIRDAFGGHLSRTEQLEAEREQSEVAKVKSDKARAFLKEDFGAEEVDAKFVKDVAKSAEQAILAARWNPDEPRNRETVQIMLGTLAEIGRVDVAGREQVIAEDTREIATRPASPPAIRLAAAEFERLASEATVTDVVSAKSRAAEMGKGAGTDADGMTASTRREVGAFSETVRRNDPEGWKLIRKSARKMGQDTDEFIRDLLGKWKELLNTDITAETMYNAFAGKELTLKQRKQKNSFAAAAEMFKAYPSEIIDVVKANYGQMEELPLTKTGRVRLVSFAFEIDNLENNRERESSMANLDAANKGLMRKAAGFLKGLIENPTDKNVAALKILQDAHWYVNEGVTAANRLTLPAFIARQIGDNPLVYRGKKGGLGQDAQISMPGENGKSTRITTRQGVVAAVRTLVLGDAGRSPAVARIKNASERVTAAKAVEGGETLEDSLPTAEEVETSLERRKRDEEKLAESKAAAENMVAFKRIGLVNEAAPLDERLAEIDRELGAAKKQTKAWRALQAEREAILTKLEGLGETFAQTTTQPKATERAEKSEAQVASEGIASAVRQLRDDIAKLDGKISYSEGKEKTGAIKAKASKVRELKAITGSASYDKAPEPVHAAHAARIREIFSAPGADMHQKLKDFTAISDNRVVRNVLPILMKFLPANSTLSFQFMPRSLPEHEGMPVAAFYNAAQNRIVVGPEGLNQKTILHELIHVATLRLIQRAEALLKRGDLGVEDQRLVDAYKDLEAIMRRVGNDQYGFSSVAEMVAEVFSNIRFQNYLRQQPAVSGLRILKHAFDQVLYSLKTMFGLTPNKAVYSPENALEQAIDLSSIFLSTEQGTEGVYFDRSAAFSRSDLANRQKQAFDNIKAGVSASVKDWAKKGYLHLAFFHDLVEMSKAVLPSIVKLDAALNAAKTSKRRIELEAEEIASRFGKLDKAVQDATNKLIETSTVGQVWGYQPAWKKTPVAIDPAAAVSWAKLGQASPEAQKVVDSVFEHGDKMKTRQIELMKAGNRTDVANTFARLAGPYAPLKRHGNYMVVAKSAELKTARDMDDKKLVAQLEADEDHYVVETYDSMGAAKIRARELEETGNYDEVDPFEKRFEAKSAQHIPAHVMQMIKSNVAATSTGNTAADRAVQTMLNDMYLNTLSEYSARQSTRLRRGTAGFDENMMRSFLTQARADAAFSTTLEHGDKINDLLNKLKSEASSGERGSREDRSRYYNMVMQHYTKSLEFNDTPWADKVMATTSFWQLLTNPSYYLANATQPFMVTLPMLEGKYGMKSWGALLDGYKHVSAVMKGRAWEPGLSFDALAKTNPNLVRALEEAQVLGVLDIGIDSEMGQFEHANNPVSKIAAKVTWKLRQVARSVEIINRVSSGVATYTLELAAQKSAGKTGEVAHKNATDAMVSILRTTQGDYSGEAAPLLIKKLPKAVTQYRKYQLMQLMLTSRLAVHAFKGASAEERSIARAQLGYIYAHAGAMAGLVGLPLYNVAAFLVSALGDDDDDDLEVILRRNMPDEMRMILSRGVPSAVGMDVSQRIGWGNAFSILPYSNIDVSRNGVKDLVFGVAGPSGGLASNFAEGAKKMGEGDMAGGMSLMMPKGLGNVIKANALATDGMRMTNDDMLMSPDEVGALDAFGQAIGLPTTTVTEKQWIKQKRYEIEQAVTVEERGARKDFRKASRDSDSEGIGKAKERWKDTQERKRELRKSDVVPFAKGELKPRTVGDMLKDKQAQRKREGELREVYGR